MINSKPLASIALICYNQESTIVEALQSLVSQDYENFELIISDDCSSDSTVNVINHFLANNSLENIKITLNVNRENLGIGGNLAKAVSLCSGEFIIPASGDDISSHTRVSTVMRAWLESNRKIGYINTDVTDIDLDGSFIKHYRADNFSKYKNLQDWLKKPQFFVGTECWSSDFYKKFPPPTNVRAEDQIMSFRAILLECGYTIHQSTLFHRLGGVTDKKPKSLKEKISSLKKEAQYSVNDFNQLLSDATSVGKQKEVECYLKSKINESEFIMKCFSNKSKLEIMALTFGGGVKMSKKIRYLSYVFLPLLHQLKYKLKI